MKILRNGVIAAVIVLAAILFCVWAGKRVAEKLPPAVETVDSLTVPKPQNRAKAQGSIEKHLAPGIPDDSTSDVQNSDRYIIAGDYHVISYNRSRSTANWVAWRLSRTDMGKLRREDDYQPDDRLPNGWNRVFPADYSGSGYTRGHLCPNADRDGDARAMASTFLMTNIVPQTYDLNAGPWLKLEDHIRDLARKGNTVYIVAGVYGEKGKIRGKITVPERNWKIALIIPNGLDIDADLKNARVIAVDMPNVDGIKDRRWKDYSIPVKELEIRTGLNFFSRLAPEIQGKLKSN